MGIGIIVIEKAWAGEVFTNTHAFFNNVAGEGLALTNNDILALTTNGNGEQAPPSDTDTDPSSPLANTTLLNAVIAFERSMLSNQVTFTRAYVSDGKTAGDATGAFATYPLGYNGLVSFEFSGGFAALNVALQIDRVPAGPSARSGRLQLRAALARNQIVPSAGDGVALDPAARAQLPGQVQQRANDSGLTDYFYNGTGSSAMSYVIPKYWPADAGVNAGALRGYTLVSGLSVKDATSRQVPRGRRRRVA